MDVDHFLPRRDNHLHIYSCPISTHVQSLAIQLAARLSCKCRYVANCCRSCGTFRKATATVASYSQRAANTTVASCQQGFTGLVHATAVMCHAESRVECHADSRRLTQRAALLAHLLPMGQKSVAVAVVLWCDVLRRCIVLLLLLLCEAAGLL